MTEEINATQRSIYTQFSLPLISRNENEENGSNNPTPVGDKDKLTPPIESSHHAERADNSSGEAAHTANGSPLKHPTSKFCFKFRENGALEEIICENINDIPQWIINKASGNYHKALKLGREGKDPHREPQTIINNNRYEIMRDKYETQGQAGAVGSNARVHDINFNQLWNQNKDLQDSDLHKLSEELSQLRGVLKKEAKTLENDKSVGEVASAEEAAKAGNGPKTLEHLKNAGKWALGAAEKIGIPLATAALKASVGL